MLPYRFEDVPCAMADLRAPRWLVLTDMHFGLGESSINDPALHEPLAAWIAKGPAWEEIVLGGDLLDANLSTCTRAIEGGRYPDVSGSLLGFRDFLAKVDEAARREGKGGLAEVAGRWIYVPGNHDYRIWDLLAAQVAFEDVVARGATLGTVPMPLASWRWDGEASFFSGLFRRFGIERRVIVTYPNHEIPFGLHGTLLCTHGHYLDPSQTGWNDLAACLRGADGPTAERIVRRIVVETAQYQVLANAVSFTRAARQLVDDVAGPLGLVNRLRRIVAAAREWLVGLLFRSEGKLRGDTLSPGLLANAEVYAERFRGASPLPRWLVFGHTHRQGRARAPSLDLDVVNAGSCFPDRGLPITFVTIEADAAGRPDVRLMCVDAKGRVRPS